MTDEELVKDLDLRIGEVLWNASNYPRRASIAMLGQDIAPLHEKVVSAALAVFREHAEPAVCSCPSGDGSLRWPCPVHPPSPTPEREYLKSVTSFTDEDIEVLGGLGDAEPVKKPYT